MGKKRKKKKVLLSGSDPFYLSKKLRRRRYGEVSAQTSQKSQNRALVKKKVAYRAPAAQACTPPTWTINRIFSKSEILAESLKKIEKKKKKKKKKNGGSSQEKKTQKKVKRDTSIFFYKSKVRRGGAGYRDWVRTKAMVCSEIILFYFFTHTTL